MKKRRLFLIALCIMSVILLIGVKESRSKLSPKHKLREAVLNLESKSVAINDLVPFSWESVYTFEPYMSQEKIEDVLGIKSKKNLSNSINEGMMHLVFVKGDQVVESILEYPQNVGYNLQIDREEGKGYGKIDYQDKALFQVEEKEGIKVLTRKK